MGEGLALLGGEVGVLEEAHSALLDYLFVEWNDKPVGFLSYGGVSGGTRAVQQLKPVISILGMVTPAPAIAVPFAPQYIGDDGTVNLPEEIAGSGKPMLAEMKRLGDLLRPEA